jgi:diguanylate cyclase
MLHDALQPATGTLVSRHWRRTVTVKFHFSTLRTALLFPFVGLIVLVTLAISALFYLTGTRAVEAFSGRMLADVAHRVNTATSEYLSSSQVVLNAVAPDAARFVPGATASITMIAPQSFEQIEARLWHASGLFPDNNEYVYFGSADGRFVGVNRSGGGNELRLKDAPQGPRVTYRSGGPGVRGDELRRDQLDTVSRPWYKAAIERDAMTWSPVYASTSSKELKITLAKPAKDANGKLLGVVATDVTLKSLAEFVSSLKVSQTGVAFIMEPSGELVATSTGESLFSVTDGKQRRLRASESTNAQVRAAYASLLQQRSTQSNPMPGQKAALTQSSFNGDNGVVDLAASAQTDDSGLNWTMIVAIPRQDFMGDVQRTLWQNFAIGLLAVGVAIAVALWITQRVVRDVSRLSDATRLLAIGQVPSDLQVTRHDELGSIARTMNQLSSRLLNDPLTGALNRTAFEKRFASFIEPDATGHAQPFALVFVDLDRFKTINDTHGHAMGDAVLAISAQRLASVLRKNDLLGRFGGDEFLLILSGLDSEAALEASLKRMREAVAQPIVIAGRALSVGASCGGALFPRDGKTLQALTDAADARMYSAKAANVHAA